MLYTLSDCVKINAGSAPFLNPPLLHTGQWHKTRTNKKAVLLQWYRAIWRVLSFYDNTRHIARFYCDW